MKWSRFTTFFVGLFVAAGLAAPPEAAAAEIKHPAQVSRAAKYDLSPPLRTIKPLQEVQAGAKAPENPYIEKKKRDTGNAPSTGADAALQQKPGQTNMPAPLVNFEGVNNTFGVLPPDTTGDVGPNHYIQWVNLGFAIYDKTGTKVYPASGSALGNTLWAGFGGACQTSNDGDPQVNYDNLADRWVMSQFALPNYPNGPFYQCFAVSQTADPLGSWHRYAWQVSATNLPDYPKVGVWMDGYHMTVNQFVMPAGSWGGLGVFVFERDKMLTGDPSAQMIYFNAGANYGGALPGDLDGQAPPVGTPNVVVEWDDSTWLGDPTDTLRVWEVRPDWTNPASSTFGTDASYTPNALIPAADSAVLCSSTRNCIPQPGTSVGLDEIGDRVMQRLQYRYIGGVGRLTTNLTVDAGSGRAGVRWFQLANPGTGWAMFDQGTYAGDAGNTEHRWMGSAALDVQGNMAVGYSVSSGSTYPSVRYNGRLAGDPVGTLGTEETLIAGAGSQTSTSYRWGDYSAMSVDPSDECTFWYTQQYYQTTSSAGWQTRVGSFKFPGCVAGPSGVIEGYVKNATSGDPIAGARVYIGPSISTLTNAAGFYQVTVAVGTYDVTASKFGYDTATATAQEVTEGNTTVVADLLLNAVGTYAVDGFVTAEVHNWPLWARIEVRQAGSLVETVYTSPWNGYYEIPALPNGLTYDFTVHSMYPGYQDEVRSVTLASGDQIQNFSLLAASGNPAYACFLDGGLNEQFEGDFPPLGWTVVNNTANTNNVWKRNDAWARDNLALGTGYCADADSDKAGSGSGNFDTELRSPLIRMPATPRVLKFLHYYNHLTTDSATVDVSTNGGAAWTNLVSWTTVDAAGEATVDLSAYANQTIMLRWRYTSSSYQWYWLIDDVRTEAPTAAPSYIESFDGTTFPPTGWTRINADGGGSQWARNSTLPYVHTGAGSAYHTYSSAAVQDGWLVSPALAIPAGGATLSFFELTRNPANYNKHSLWACTASCTTPPTNYTEIAAFGSPVTAWRRQDVNLSAYAGGNVTLAFRYQGNASTTAAYWYIDDVQIPTAFPVVDTPSLSCEALPGTMVAGYVTDANTSAGIVGATVQTDLGTVTTTTAGMANVGDGFYFMYSPIGSVLTPNGPSTRTITASKTGFGTVAQDVNLVPDTMNRLDFSLPAAQLSLADWEFVVDGRMTPDAAPASEKTQTFSVLNTGGLPANVKFFAQNLGSGYVPPRPNQPVGAATMKPEFVAQQPYSLKGIPRLPRPAKPTPPVYAAGDILGSWATGLTLPWGAGVTGDNVWASNPSAGGGDDYDNEFTATGSQTGRRVQAVFGGSWAADMTRADASGMLWQVNVGGDNCIYELDPDSGATGNKICPAFATSQRGLAYDPDTDSFFAGNWTDTTIYRFDRTGAILQQVNSGLDVSGLAYNPATQHLFVMTNAVPNLVHVLDVANSYATLGTFSIAGFGDYSGSGIEFGCNGLWAMNQTDGKAYLVDAGESYPCNPNLPWFTMTPTEGAVPAESGTTPGQLDILGEFFPEGVAPAHYGLFRGRINSTNDTPVVLPSIPVFFTKSFWDVPHNSFADEYIHALAGARLTKGCGGGNFCPENNLTRAEMAVQMVRAMYGPDFAPAPAVGIFSDVVISDTDTTADYIEQLYNDGVVAGCGTSPLRYCPTDLVNRAQMSVFLVKGLLIPVGTDTGYFTDVSGTPFAGFAPYVEGLFNAGITAGCGDHVFCPTSNITRSQLAVWLVKALAIPHYGHPTAP